MPNAHYLLDQKLHLIKIFKFVELGPGLRAQKFQKQNKKIVKNQIKQFGQFFVTFSIKFELFFFVCVPIFKVFD